LELQRRYRKNDYVEEYNQKRVKNRDALADVWNDLTEKNGLWVDVNPRDL
jgi:hypothetical protein